MSKAKKSVVVADAAPVAAPQLFCLGKLPRNGLSETTKYGTKGNAGSYAAVCAALVAAGGSADLATLAAAAVGGNAAKKSFVRYAVRNHWLLPVETK